MVEDGANRLHAELQKKLKTVGNIVDPSVPVGQDEV